jgi:hypothetical protein
VLYQSIKGQLDRNPHVKDHHFGGRLEDGVAIVLLQKLRHGLSSGLPHDAQLIVQALLRGVGGQCEEFSSSFDDEMTTTDIRVHLLLFGCCDCR